MTIKGDVYRAAHNYLVDGPMVGVFKVCEDDLDLYGETTGFDVIHFVNDVVNDFRNLSHLITVSGMAWKSRARTGNSRTHVHQSGGELRIVMVSYMHYI